MAEPVSSTPNASKPMGGEKGSLPILSRRNLLKTVAGTTAMLSSGSLVAAAQNTPIDGRVKRDKPIRERMGSYDTPFKERAARDYANSLHAYGGRLSNPTRSLFATAENSHKIHFGVVVIGSGYGASVTAARLSQYLKNDHRICILERGKEWIPGTFPDKFPDVMSNATTSLVGPTKGQRSQPLGLFDISMNEQVNILSGNGLGGGSLINASIAMRPHPDVFQQPEWPVALQDVDVLGPYFDMLAQSLSMTRTPLDQTPKVRSRRLAAQRMSSHPDFFDLPPVSVMYDHRYLDDQLRNRQGMVQRPCNLCGCCINGCNIGAKNTLTMNYLPVAKQNGTEMYTQMEVLKIIKREGFYQILAEYVDDTENKITRHPVTINTRMVVLGAGSPHSAALLLESQNDRFQFSPALGNYWTGNGDTVGFVIDMPEGTNIGGYGAYHDCVPPVGPTVQTSLNYYREIEISRRLLIQEAAIPRGVSNLFTLLLRDPKLNKSMVMLGMGHDGHQGKIQKKEGRYQVVWEGMKEIPYRYMVFDEFNKLAQAHGGKYKRLKLFGDNLVTVHPLGGCRMSDDPCCGPLNHLGQVYDMAHESCGYDRQPKIHHGLYVADGSVMSTSLGVNPYMTIGAMAERIAHHIVHNPTHADLFETPQFARAG